MRRIDADDLEGLVTHSRRRIEARSSPSQAMKRRILKKPQVERDLIDHFSYIARDKIKPAERFLQMAEESFSRLAANPSLGQPWESPLPQLAGIRVHPMPSPYRKYLVFYRQIENGVEVLTVLHGARDLQAALERLLIGE